MVSQRIKEISYAIREIAAVANKIAKSGKKIYHLNIGDPVMYDFMCCVSKYPANTIDYENNLISCLRHGISDHTTDWNLFLKYHPEIYEFHFKLSDSTGLDAGEFARTPEQITEVYNLL